MIFFFVKKKKLAHILQNGAVNFMQALNCFFFYLYIESSMW